MISVVIPTTRPTVEALIESLGEQTHKPDEILVVSNEVSVPGVVNFWSEEHPIGDGDAGLRRDIGADLAEGDILLFLDDDVIAPRNLVEKAAEIVERDGFCWGHHRYIDFEAHPLEELLDLPPEAGNSREAFVNGWHGWQSSYAGNLAIRRDLFWEVGGFDLAYLGHHGSEDQQLGRRLGAKNGYRTFVHEPPFAWHPTLNHFHSEPKRNMIGTHRMEVKTINGHEFLSCEECPCRRPVDVLGLTMSEQVVIRYSREQFTLKKERI